MPVTRRDTLLSAGTLAAASVIPPAVAVAQESAPLVQQASAVVPEPICLADFEPLAKAKMPTMGWEYINGGADDELTLRWNKEAFQRIRLKPHVLVDVSKPDTRVTFFGKTTPSQFFWLPQRPKVDRSGR